MWKVIATLPTLHRKDFGTYTHRGCAENDAQKYKRIMGSLYTIRVVWWGEDNSEF